MKPLLAFFGGQGIGWALDEDLDRARAALGDRVGLVPFGRAPLVHSAWWPPIVSAGPAPFRGKSLVCFADNPPAFYLTRPGFEQAASRVDLWVARSSEAVAQFRELGLPVAFAPYCLDDGVFFPLRAEERTALRSRLGFAPEDFVVGNFHRDSIQRNVRLPKMQKGPDLFLEVVERARMRIPHLRVLLAGPRRHWLRSALNERGIPTTFAGEAREDDDFPLNVLPRAELNRLYSVLDAVVISSRWEGGPYSALEALAAGRPVLSTPVGMAADVLPGWIFKSPDQAAELLDRIAQGTADFAALRERAAREHSPQALGVALERAYAPLNASPWRTVSAALSSVRLFLSRFHPVLRGRFPAHPQVARAMEMVANREESAGLSVVSEAIKIADAETSVFQELTGRMSS